MTEINNFDEWIQFGMDKGWCGPPLCEMHDGLPYTKAEMDELDAGNDPCIHVIRMFESPEDKAEAEAEHGPSQWRNHWKQSSSSVES